MLAVVCSLKFNVGFFPGYPQGGMEYDPEKKYSGLAQVIQTHLQHNNIIVDFNNEDLINSGCFYLVRLLLNHMDPPHLHQQQF